MTVRFSGFAGEYPAEARAALALSRSGLSYPAAETAAASLYFSNVGVTMPLWFAGGCCPSSPIADTFALSIADANACRTPSLLVALCDGSTVGTSATFSTGGDQVWVSCDLVQEDGLV